MISNKQGAVEITQDTKIDHLNQTEKCFKYYFKVAEVHSEPSQTSSKEFFTEIVNS